MSDSTCALAPGRWIFTTTSPPSSKLARCTRAMDAEARGTGSICSKTSETAHPNAAGRAAAVTFPLRRRTLRVGPTTLNQGPTAKTCIATGNDATTVNHCDV